VTADDHIAANDALAIINYINAFTSGPVPSNAAIGQPFGFLDTIADDNIAPNDALEVINSINAGFGGEGEAMWSGQAIGGREPGIGFDELTLLLAIDVATQSKRR